MGKKTHEDEIQGRVSVSGKKTNKDDSVRRKSCLKSKVRIGVG